jgi:UDP-N-acetyl-D-mannosaminuronic acid dehydrogenase
VYVAAVPTPYDKVSKKIDASFVIGALNNILDTCPKGAIIVIESTISPGTIDRFVRPLVKAKGLQTGKDVHLVHAPERIIPGNMIFELQNNSRTIGADDPKIGERVKQIYSSFCKGEIIMTDIKTAEMTKVIENTYRDINIAFANELTKICRANNMNVYEVIRIANKHPRVNILNPGPGVGGHCISVDPWFLVGDYPELARLIKEARMVNDSMPDFVLGRIAEIMRENGLTDVSRVGFYGLTYKENVDDIRESPTLQMLDSMERHLAGGVKVYDPFIHRDIVKNQCHSLKEFLDGSDMVVILVGHNEIKENMDLLKGKIVLDTRNICPFENKYTL